MRKFPNICYITPIEDMTKAELIHKVSKNTGLTKVEVSMALESIVEYIMVAIEKGERVDFRGFGSFNVKRRGARQGINPATQDVITIKEKYIPFFKASKKLMKRVNKKLLRGF